MNATTMVSIEDVTPDQKEQITKKVRDNPHYLDYDWWDTTYEDFMQVAEAMGITVLQEDIYFSGFCRQGDGASFKASFEMPSWPIVKGVKANYPQDTELHRIAYEIWDVQRRNFYRVYGKIDRSGYYYYHAYTMGVEAYNSDTGAEVQQKYERQLLAAVQDLANWLYRNLEKEYDYLMSDEGVWEYIKNNHCHAEFDEDGDLEGIS